MTDVILFAILGLGTGALIAGVAVAVVLTYRGSGVINLATGAVAMTAGYGFWALRSGIPELQLPTPLAVLGALLAAVALSVGVQATVFRPLRKSSPLAKIVASLGVLIALQAAAVLIFGQPSKQSPNILPTGTIKVLGIEMPVDRLWLTGIVLALTAALVVCYRRTRFGLATRAASENEVAGMLAGLAPERLAMANAVLSAIVAGLIGILAGPLVELNSTSLPLVVVPALGAALFAGFTSLSIACIAGILIGIAQSLIYYVSTLSWFPTDNGNALPGVQSVLTFLIIVAALWWRGGRVPGRGEIVERRLPAVPVPEALTRPTVLLGGGAAVLLAILPYDYRQALMVSLIGVVVCLSLVVITGYVGQVSLAQVAIAGVSGFVVSRLAGGAGVGFPLAPIIGSLAATIVGTFVGVSALRVRGVSLAVVTLAAAVAIQDFGFTNSTWGAGVTGSPVPQPTLAGLNLGSTSGFRGLDGAIPSPVLGFVFLVVVIGMCLLVAHLRRSTLGKRMVAVRSNERAAAAAGIDVRQVKIVAFGLSSFIAGTAGWMYAYNFGSVSSDRFGILTGLAFVAFAYIGGITMVSGALIGGFVVTQGISEHFVNSTFGISGTWTLLVGGLVLIINMVVWPEGIAGSAYIKREQRRRSEQRTPAQRLRARVLPSTSRVEQ